MGQYLIISRTARALAASAVRAKHAVHCIDCFADDDTKSMSISTRRLGDAGGGFNPQDLIDAVMQVLNESPKISPDISIVIGSGFESNPYLLDRLMNIVPVIGNPPASVSSLKDPLQFSALLSRHDIKHPPTTMTKPGSDTGYLAKKPGGDGGTHVQWSAPQKHIESANSYYQKYIPGTVMSAVFLTNGDAIKIIGINEQFQTDQFTERPFLYKGAITQYNYQASLFDELERIISAITSEIELKGLCGLDFILAENGSINVLEVNPRPPATFEIHESGRSLFAAHVSAFTGRKIIYERHTDNQYRAYTIIYADHEIRIPDRPDWPAWVKDRPATGKTVRRQSPVCTVFAAAKDKVTAQKLVYDREQAILEQLRSSH